MKFNLVILSITSNFVDILKGQPEGLIGGTGRGNDGVEGLEEGGSGGLAFLPLNSPSLRERRELSNHYNARLVRLNINNI